MLRQTEKPGAGLPGAGLPLLRIDLIDEMKQIPQIKDVFVAEQS